MSDNSRARAHLISYTHGYLLAWEDVLRDMEGVNSISRLREIALQSVVEAKQTLRLLRGETDEDAA